MADAERYRILREYYAALKLEPKRNRRRRRNPIYEGHIRWRKKMQAQGKCHQCGGVLDFYPLKQRFYRICAACRAKCAARYAKKRNGIAKCLMDNDSMEPELPPEKAKPTIDERANNWPKDESAEHRIEAKAYGFLSLWILADILLGFGHVHLAVWLFYIVLVAGLGLFTIHSIKGWPDRKKHFTWAYVLCCLLLPIILYCAFHFKKSEQSTESAFFVKTIFANISTKNETQLFLLWEYQTKALIPINIQMLIQLGNLKPAGLKISSLQFEGKAKDGKWIVFPMIDRQFGDLGVHQGNYWGIQNPTENPDPLKTYFPEAIYRNPLLLEPITAYALLEVPKGASTEFLRLRILDAGGKEYVENVNLKPETNRLQVLIHDNLPMITYRAATNDFNQVPVIPYSFIFDKYGPPGF